MPSARHRHDRKPRRRHPARQQAHPASPAHRGIIQASPFLLQAPARRNIIIQASAFVHWTGLLPHCQSYRTCISATVPSPPPGEAAPPAAHTPPSTLLVRQPFPSPRKCSSSRRPSPSGGSGRVDRSGSRNSGLSLLHRHKVRFLLPLTRTVASDPVVRLRHHDVAEHVRKLRPLFTDLIRSYIRDVYNAYIGS